MKPMEIQVIQIHIHTKAEPGCPLWAQREAPKGRGVRAEQKRCLLLMQKQKGQQRWPLFGGVAKAPGDWDCDSHKSKDGFTV